MTQAYVITEPDGTGVSIIGFHGSMDGPKYYHYEFPSTTRPSILTRGRPGGVGTRVLTRTRSQSHSKGGGATLRNPSYRANTRFRRSHDEELRRKY